jgi:hypothetical protein
MKPTGNRAGAERIDTLRVVAVAFAVAIILQPAAANAQRRERGAASYSPPMTPWGEPELQGIWPLSNLIGTPLERPEEFGERLMLTDEEFAAAQARVEQRNESFSTRAIPVADEGQVLRQTSLIVDPPNGRFPELTPYGKELQSKMNSSYEPGKTVFDNIDDFDSWDRCITRGMPVSMFPRNYNNGIQIVQSPGYVVLVLEMAHEARVIPTDGRGPIEPEIKQWMGESRGRWEGNTLVVETTNFNGLTGTTNAGVPGSPRPLHPSTENMHIVERFTRVAEDTIEYQITITDSEVTIPGSWTVAYPMQLDNSYVPYEYACHEGNTAVRNYIETSRFERRQQAPQAPQ